MGSPSIITNPMFNMGFLLICMQLAKKVDFNNPDVLTFARIGYYSAQALVVAMAYGLIVLIKKKNDTTVLTYTPAAKPSFGAPATPPETVSTTIRDYDVDQVKQFIQSTVTSIFIISLMHWQFKFTQPLLMQSLMPLKNLFTHKEALIHLWGDTPEGKLARPFIAENPLGGIASMFGVGNDSSAPTEDNHSHRE